jgi:hypothetical protein
MYQQFFRLRINYARFSLVKSFSMRKPRLQFTHQTASHKIISEVSYRQSSITKTKTHITVITCCYELGFYRPVLASSNRLFI